jgi:hypothetical protein
LAELIPLSVVTDHYLDQNPEGGRPALELLTSVFSRKRLLTTRGDGLSMRQVSWVVGKTPEKGIPYVAVG